MNDKKKFMEQEIKNSLLLSIVRRLLSYDASIVENIRLKLSEIKLYDKGCLELNYDQGRDRASEIIEKILDSTDNGLDEIFKRKEVLHRFECENNGLTIKEGSKLKVVIDSEIKERNESLCRAVGEMFRTNLDDFMELDIDKLIGEAVDDEGKNKDKKASDDEGKNKDKKAGLKTDAQKAECLDRLMKNHTQEVVKLQALTVRVKETEGKYYLNKSTGVQSSTEDILSSKVNDEVIKFIDKAHKCLPKPKRTLEYMADYLYAKKTILATGIIGSHVIGAIFNVMARNSKSSGINALGNTTHAVGVFQMLIGIYRAWDFAKSQRCAIKATNKNLLTLKQRWQKIKSQTEE